MKPMGGVVRLCGLCTVVGLLLGLAPTAAFGQSAIDVARAYVQSNHSRFGLTGSDINEYEVSSSVLSQHNGVTHVYFQQKYRGIEVLNGILNVNVDRNGRVLSAGSRFVSQIASQAGGQSPRKLAAEAAMAAAGHVNLRPTAPIQPMLNRNTQNQSTMLSDGGVAARPIEAKLVWAAVDGGVRLAWSVEIEETSGQHWWMALVDADNGNSLGQQDLVINDSIAATAGAVTPSSVNAAPLPAFPNIDGSLYNVFPQPFESPNDGGRSLVGGAANPNASPFGWHDTNAVAGPEFTRTRGNNVHAYTDLDANNVADPGSDPDGTAALLFDFPFNQSMDPSTYRPAAVTNLFYWNNIMHDVTYNYGFDPASGNFQVNTYGNGGVGNDDVRAEAQDGSGTNNANFATGVDGVRPRMQMFIWTHPFPNFVTVNSPGAIAGDYAASGAVFGPTPATTGPITGNVTLVNDGVGATSDGCEPLVGFPAGDIALLDRGTCTFVSKVANAQAVGASAVIVVNNVPGNPITMGGADPTIVIPSVMLSLDNGNLLKANLPVNGTVRANPLTSINRDSDIDAGVICHEYGHGISNRLTGGPATTACLGNAEQMGEGWSDWFALTLTTNPADTATTPRGIGNYLLFANRADRGIRPTQYTTDMSVNPATYAGVADTVNISQPHGIGYIWTSMLWEVYWNLVDRHGYNANIYDNWTTGGNNLAFQLVMDGMKFQPCRPGFVDGRDGILTADMALTGGANQCEIWRGFAKRGLGFSANQGLSSSRTDGVEAFDLPATCTGAVFGGFKPPVYSLPTVNVVNAGSTVPVKFTLSGATSLSIDSQRVDCTTLVPVGETPVAPAMPGGTVLTQSGNSYQFNWQTDAAWANSCRRLTLRIPAAADAVAYFSFH